jgi:hypothetical protein
LDEITEFYGRLCQQDPNGRHELKIYDNLPHVFQMFSVFKESDEALENAIQFFNKIGK